MPRKKKPLPPLYVVVRDGAVSYETFRTQRLAREVAAYIRDWEPAAKIRVVRYVPEEG
jgi:hypothetical protein